MIPAVLLSLGAPLGEPVADDWDFVFRALLTSDRSLLDGGGSTAFWRPLPHQIYYRLCSSLMLSRPLVIAALHVLLLGLMALLAYRAARTRLPAPAAATLASFPLLAESARTIVAWPSHMVELSFMFFSVLALHEAAYRRLATALLALLAALLSKEVAVATALLLPWVPRLAPRSGDRRARGERLRWMLAVAAVTVAWGICYLAVRRVHDLHLPHDLEQAAASAGVSWPGRYGWAIVNSARAAFSLAPARSPWEPIAWGGLTLIAIAAAWFVARNGAARARLRAALPLVTLGLAWFAVAAAPLVVVHPFWMPHRSAFASYGLGLALVAALGAARPALLAALVALRVVLLIASPGAPRVITALPAASGAFLDFERLARLQRVMVETRRALAERFPTLPRGASVVQHNLPLVSYYAFGGSLALQCWYRDSTLRWLPFDAFRADTSLHPATIVEWQPEGRPQVALVEPAAMRALIEASDRIAAADWRAALTALDRAARLESEGSPRVFLGTVASKRALVLVALERPDEALIAAREGLRLWPQNPDSRFAIGQVLLAAGRASEAVAQLDSLLALYPDDAQARDLRERARQAGGPGRSR